MATPPAVNVIVLVPNPSLVSGSPICRISFGMNTLVPSNWKFDSAFIPFPPVDVSTLSLLPFVTLFPADIPVNAEPSPENAVAVTVPVTVAPALVVSNFLLLLC